MYFTFHFIRLCKNSVYLSLTSFLHVINSLLFIIEEYPNYKNKLFYKIQFLKKLHVPNKVNPPNINKYI